jgi:hypothetical protein
MKKLFTILMLLFGFLINSFSQACEIPPNYFQDPNFEHKLSPLVWTGAFDWISWGAWQPYSHPDFWVTDTTETHSGSKCLVITADSWIWPTVSTVGFEEKSMKMSFWYKAPLGKMGFWMFAYRDALLTPEEIRPPLPEDLVGADTAYITITAGIAKEEAIYFEMPPAQDWTYFEFKFDYPGSILGPTMTLMFWSQFTAGFIDDVYYGVDFDCVYNGEEAVELANHDFEADGLGTEWLINIFGGSSTEFLTTDENHTDLGSQSLRLWKNRTATYYMPALGTQSQNMNLSFWHKGNSGSVRLNIYDDFGIGTGNFAVPSGATLVVDSIPVYVEDTIDMEITPIPIYDHSQILESTPTGNTISVIDTANVPTSSMGFQDFEVGNEAPLPIDGQWSANSLYSDWASTMPDDAFFSPHHALYLPGDPDWTGVWGALDGFVDNKAYALSFMYKGKLSFELFLGRDFKYPLDDDPAGLVPANASVTAEGAIHWDLDASDWTEFSFAGEIGTLFADSGITTPVSLGFNFAGTSTWDDVGYVDDFQGRYSVNGLGAESYIKHIPEVTNTYALHHTEMDTTYIIGVVDTTWTLDPIALKWNLPASENWTQFNYNWTNPQGDIGGTLTMILGATEGSGSDTITYFDDFDYGLPSGVPNHENKFNSISVYPNPASDILYIKTSRELNRASFYNSLGQQVKTINKPENHLNISGLSEGVYILQITDKEGIEYRARFIKK